MTIARDKPLASLRADSGDRFEGERFLYPNRRPITRLRFLGEAGGKFYYAAIDDLTAALPADPAPIIRGGKFVGTKVES